VNDGFAGLSGSSSSTVIIFDRRKEIEGDLPPHCVRGAPPHGTMATSVERVHPVSVVGPVSSKVAGIPQKFPWMAQRVSSSASSAGVRCP